MVKDVLNGFNAAVFAYGATGSGKTHTMLGPCRKKVTSTATERGATAAYDVDANNNESGLMVRAIEEIFRNIDNTTNNGSKVCWVSKFLLTLFTVLYNY